MSVAVTPGGGVGAGGGLLEGEGPRAEVDGDGGVHQLLGPPLDGEGGGDPAPGVLAGGEGGLLREHVLHHGDGDGGGDDGLDGAAGGHDRVRVGDGAGGDLVAVGPALAEVAVRVARAGVVAAGEGERLGGRADEVGPGVGVGAGGHVHGVRGVGRRDGGVRGEAGGVDGQVGPRGAVGQQLADGGVPAVERADGHEGGIGAGALGAVLDVAVAGPVLELEVRVAGQEQDAAGGDGTGEGVELVGRPAPQPEGGADVGEVGGGREVVVVVGGEGVHQLDDLDGGDGGGGGAVELVERGVLERAAEERLPVEVGRAARRVAVDVLHVHVGGLLLRGDADAVELAVVAPGDPVVGGVHHGRLPQPLVARHLQGARDDARVCAWQPGGVDPGQLLGGPRPHPPRRVAAEPHGDGVHVAGVAREAVQA